MALGWPDPDLLLDVISFETYIGWQRFYTADPFGGQRGDLQAGITAQAAIAPWATNEIPLHRFLLFPRGESDISVDALEEFINQRQAEELKAKSDGQSETRDVRNHDQGQ